MDKSKDLSVEWWVNGVLDEAHELVVMNIKPSNFVQTSRRFRLGG